MEIEFKHQSFSFENVADLNLSPMEMLATHNLFDKLKSTPAGLWKLDNQTLTEKLLRGVRICIVNKALPSVVLSQMVLESGWFAHEESATGIKATKEQIENGNIVTEDTHEDQKGVPVPAIGTFFKSSTVEEAFQNMFEYLKRQKPQTNRYLPSNALDYLEYLQDAKAPASDGKPSGAYSTADQEYVKSVMSVSRSNNFGNFDHI